MRHSAEVARGGPWHTRLGDRLIALFGRGQALQDLALYCGWPVPTALGNTVIVLARLGDCRARNHDPPPGPPKVGDGCTCLIERVAVYETRRDLQRLGSG